ncbi:uncharacterized protein LOC120347566 isoform X1 [Styela clava]
MSAAATKSTKMDEYFRIAFLFSFAVAINGIILTGSGANCNTKCGAAKETCFALDNNACYCPAGFKGVNCDEPNTDYIDETCAVPKRIPEFCGEAIDLCGNCDSGSICCSNGCILSCLSLPSPTCTSTTDCPGNKICYETTPPPHSCLCPFGFRGDDCMEREVGYDDRCPFPDNPADLCEQAEFETFDECAIDVPGLNCPDGNICCLGSDGCSFKCFPIGCKNAVILKTCTDQRKLCIDDDSTDGFTCQCPLGYSGFMCATRFAGIDKQCPFPEVSKDTCDEFETPPCMKATDCEDDEVCCSTGCGTACVKLSDKKQPQKISKLTLIALLMSLTNRPKQTVPRPPIVQVGPYAQAAPHEPYVQAAPHVPYVQAAPAVPVVQIAPAGAACGPGEALVHGCPDVCQGARCVNYSYAICRVHPCNRCTARWYTRQGHDVTASCGQVVG